MTAVFKCISATRMPRSSSSLAFSDADKNAWTQKLDATLQALVDTNSAGPFDGLLTSNWPAEKAAAVGQSLEMTITHRYNRLFTFNGASLEALKALMEDNMVVTIRGNRSISAILSGFQQELKAVGSTNTMA